MKLAYLTIALLTATNLAAEVKPPQGFTALFNGKDLEGWRGGTTFDHRKLLAMPEAERNAKIEGWTKSMTAVNPKTNKPHWYVEGDELVNDGFGDYATTIKDYGNFELVLEYKTVAEADSGVYLRGVPQVQIWDSTLRTPGAIKNGNPKGSGGLWNNSPGTPGKDPLVVADKPFGEWNSFRVIMVGSRVSVWLNDKLVVDHAIMENYYNRSLPVPSHGPIQLQTHGGEIRWRNIFIREIGPEETNSILSTKNNEGFKSVFNGKNLQGWAGPVENYQIEESGAMRMKQGSSGNIYLNEELSDFVVRLEYSVPPGGNSGLAIRYPGKGNPAYDAMTEIQVLDDDAPKYAKLDARQYNGGVYGLVAAHKGYANPANTWNFEEVTVKGSTIKVELNGVVIINTDVSKLDLNKAMDNKAHPGLNRTKGFFGFAGHSDPVAFRNISIKKLN